MFIINSLLLLGSVMGVTLIPFLFPFVIGLIGTLLRNEFDPNYLIIITIIGSLIIGNIRYYGDKKIMTRINKTTLLKNKKKPALMVKIEGYLNTTNIGYILWCIIVIAARSGFPDFLTIRIVRQKVNIYQWLSAYITGKMLLYIPIIYGGNIILKWFFE